MEKEMIHWLVMGFKSQIKVVNPYNVYGFKFLCLLVHWMEYSMRCYLHIWNHPVLIKFGKVFVPNLMKDGLKLPLTQLLLLYFVLEHFVSG